MNGTELRMELVNLKNAFIDVGLFFENRQEARKLGPVSKPDASDWSRRSVRRVFSRDNPTSMIQLHYSVNYYLFP